MVDQAYGNGPNSLSSPVPNQPSAALNPGAYEMPETEITARAPAAQSAGSPDLGDFGSLPSAGQPTTQTPESASGSDLGDFASLPASSGPSNEAELPTPSDAADLGISAPPQPQLKITKMPDGQYGVYDPTSNQIRSLSAQEKAALKYTAHAIRIGGPVVGTVLGEMLPVPGTTPGGAVLGGEAAHIAASSLEEIAGEKPQPRTNKDRAIDAASASVGKYVLGPALGKFADTVADPTGKVAAAEAASGATGAEAVNQIQQSGKQAIEQKQAQGQQAVQDAGVPDLPQGTPKTPETEAGVQQTIQDKFKAFKDKFSGKPRVTPGEYANDFEDNHAKSIGALADKAAETARDRQFDVNEVKAKFEEVLNQRGLLNDDGSVNYDRANDSEKPLLRAYEKFRSETQPGVSSSGLGSQGNKVPNRVNEGFGDSSAPAKQVQEGIRGMTQQGQKGFAEILLGPESKQMTVSPENGATPYKTFGNEIEIPNQSHDTSHTQMGLDLNTTQSQPKAVSELPPNAAGEGNRGVTLKDMNRWLKTFEKGADFQNMNRDSVNRDFGELYHEMRMKRDGVTADVFDEAGQSRTAQALRNMRNSYSQNVETIRDLKGAIEKDPERSYELGIQKDDVATVQRLKRALPRETFANLGGQLLDGVEQKLQNEGVDAARAELNKKGTRVAQELLGPDNYTQLNQLFNAGKVLEGRQVDLPPPAKSKLIQTLTRIVMYPKYAGAHIAAKMVDAMADNPKFASSAADLRALSKAPVSKTARAAGAGMGATIGELYNQK